MVKNIKIIASVLATVLLLSACGGEKKQQASSVVSFKTTKVKKQDLTLNSKFSATIRGRQDIEVYPQVGGTLQRLCVTEGQNVKKGQTLFIIDQVPYQTALNTAEAALKAAQAQEATAKLTYDSRKELFDQQIVSEYDLQTAYNALLTAKASVAQAQAQVVNARNSLSYTVVKSPANGVVGTLPFRQGALVGPSMPMALTTVSDNNQMYVYFSLPESQFLEMTRESGSTEKAIAEMPSVQLQLVDGSIYEATGVVETASGVVDRATGSVQLRAVFNNPSHVLHSGSTGNVVIPVEYKDVLVVPAAATVQTQDKFKVFVVEKDGTANSKIVSILPQNNGKEFIVTEGLEEGMEIVAEGASMVKEGQKVKE
ncbi:MAG: efflux RND transporter periplasmic adaptor subunit [Bacteroidaceae bacterium]|nr:efflux RND transporter periplasmic adaptor subunit [Bacteroidaceae bacterium]